MHIAGALPIRRGEERLVGLLVALFAVAEMGRGVAEVAADALFLSTVDYTQLPPLYVVLGLVGLVVVLGYGAAIGRLDRRRFLVTLLCVLGGILFLERIVLVSDTTQALQLVWLTVQLTGALLLTVLWTVAGTTLDTRQARRLFPVCTGAAIAGSFAGTLLAGPLVLVIGGDDVLVVAGLLLIVAAAITGRVLAAAPASRGTRPSRSFVQDLAAGYQDVRRSPLMRLVAAAYALFAVLMFAVSFPFYGSIQAWGTSEAEIATLLGLVSAGVTAVAFVVAMTVAGRVYARIGVAGAALVLPVVYLIGFGTWLVSFGLVTAIGVRSAQQVTQRGLSNAAWSSMFNVVPVERRPQVLAFMDGVPGQLGTVLSGVLLMIAVAWLAPSQVFLVGLGAAAVCVVVVLAIRRRYGEALLAGLRAGLGEQVLDAGPGLMALDRDPQVRAQLRTAAGGPTAAGRRLAVEVLGQLGDEAEGGTLTQALDDPDASVRAVALRSLAAFDGPWDAVGPPGVVDDRLWTDADPGVRGELAAGLARHDQMAAARRLAGRLLQGDDDERLAGLRAVSDGAITLDAADAAILDMALRDGSPPIRAAALGAMRVIADPADAQRALLAGLDDDAASVRAAAATDLTAIPDSGTAVVAVLTSGSPRAQEAALSALHQPTDEMRDSIRAWALGQVARVEALDRLETALAPGPTGAGASDTGASDTPEIRFLAAIMGRRRADALDRLVLAAAALGSPGAAGPIRRALRSDDRDARAQAIEAVDSMGDRRLGSAIARLIEHDGTRGGASSGDPMSALDTLGHDDDPWVRAVAVRAQSTMLAARWQRLAATAAADPDPHVRAAVNSEEGRLSMATTDRTLDDIDRMLLLREVPLFARLAPEDLQRLASSATERFIPTGEPLVREGEPGDELIVIVSGDVRVERADGAGVRVLRTYQAGDHIGELAVLTDRPRAATVVAEHDVRGLVVGGGALRAILQERPEAAMAMLTTLAGRIAAQ